MNFVCALLLCIFYSVCARCTATSVVFRVCKLWVHSTHRTAHINKYAHLCLPQFRIARQASDAVSCVPHFRCFHCEWNAQKCRKGALCRVRAMLTSLHPFLRHFPSAERSVRHKHRVNFFVSFIFLVLFNCHNNYYMMKDLCFFFLFSVRERILVHMNLAGTQANTRMFFFSALFHARSNEQDDYNDDGRVLFCMWCIC